METCTSSTKKPVITVQRFVVSSHAEVLIGNRVFREAGTRQGPRDPEIVAVDRLLTTLRHAGQSGERRDYEIINKP